jgi:hypothetical protein
MFTTIVVAECAAVHQLLALLVRDGRISIAHKWCPASSRPSSAVSKVCSITIIVVVILGKSTLDSASNPATRL